ncbi:hypothetical protein M8J77_008706 [Diaphorina citri]|nr:hypothetical protein M8J77_008706 [Diaphorina citri]
MDATIPQLCKFLGDTLVLSNLPVRASDPGASSAQALWSSCGLQSSRDLDSELYARFFIIRPARLDVAAYSHVSRSSLRQGAVGETLGHVSSRVGYILLLLWLQPTAHALELFATIEEPTYIGDLYDFDWLQKVSWHHDEVRNHVGPWDIRSIQKYCHHKYGLLTNNVGGYSSSDPIWKRYFGTTNVALCPSLPYNIKEPKAIARIYRVLARDSREINVRLILAKFEFADIVYYTPAWVVGTTFNDAWWALMADRELLFGNYHVTKNPYRTMAVNPTRYRALVRDPFAYSVCIHGENSVCNETLKGIDVNTFTWNLYRAGLPPLWYYVDEGTKIYGVVEINEELDTELSSYERVVDEGSWYLQLVRNVILALYNLVKPYLGRFEDVIIMVTDYIDDQGLWVDFAIGLIVHAYLGNFYLDALVVYLVNVLLCKFLGDTLVLSNLPVRASDPGASSAQALWSSCGLQSSRDLDRQGREKLFEAAAAITEAAFARRGVIFRERLRTGIAPVKVQDWLTKINNTYIPDAEVLRMQIRHEACRDGGFLSLGRLPWNQVHYSSTLYLRLDIGL